MRDPRYAWAAEVHLTEFSSRIRSMTAEDLEGLRLALTDKLMTINLDLSTPPHLHKNKQGVVMTAEESQDWEYRARKCRLIVERQLHHLSVRLRAIAGQASTPPAPTDRFGGQEEMVAALYWMATSRSGPVTHDDYLALQLADDLLHSRASNRDR